MPNLALGDYRLDVLNRSVAADSYAVAWMVPEPGTLVTLLMIVSLPALMRRGQRRCLQGLPVQVAHRTGARL